ncbi:hypothetical protein ACIQVF_09300 [Streptomyces tendae]|uniref:hypothetical protein n=1 Tax=Streptomyces tendae TaxID=1932 RepID=UPI0033BC6F84
MRPAPRAAVRHDAWLRVLVLVLVLLVPCTHVTVQAAPVAAAAGEYDHLDSALRVAPRSSRRAAVVRPTPPPIVAGRRAPLRFDARTGRAAPLPDGPRSVVLRC